MLVVLLHAVPVCITFVFYVLHGFPQKILFIGGMGCASSAASPAADTKEAQAALASRQRRKLSVAPGHVGDISPGSPGANAVENDINGISNLSELEVAAKGRLIHAVLSRKGFVPYSKKKVNQDRPVLKYAVGENVDVSMFGVMDGHGEFGHEVSSFVQTQLPQYLAKVDTRTHTTMLLCAKISSERAVYVLLRAIISSEQLVNKIVEDPEAG
jgi:hypothetical protein